MQSVSDQSHCHACISALLIADLPRNKFDFHFLHFYLMLTIKVIVCGQSNKHLVKIFRCGIQYNLLKHNNRLQFCDPRSIEVNIKHDVGNEMK